MDGENDSREAFKSSASLDIIWIARRNHDSGEQIIWINRVSLKDMYVWGVNSIVTKHSDYFVWKDTSERVTRRCDDTVDKKQVNSCVLKCLFLEGVEQPNKSPKNLGNAFSDELLMSRFQNFAADAASTKNRGFLETQLRAVLFNELIRSQRFWEVISLTVTWAAGPRLGVKLAVILWLCDSVWGRTWWGLTVRFSRAMEGPRYDCRNLIAQKCRAGHIGKRIHIYSRCNTCFQTVYQNSEMRKCETMSPRLSLGPAWLPWRQGFFWNKKLHDWKPCFKSSFVLGYSNRSMAIQTRRIEVRLHKGKGWTPCLIVNTESILSKVAALLLPAQGWKNCTLVGHEGGDSRFLVLAGRE